MQEDFGKNEASATVQAECRLALSQILGTANEWKSGSCKDSGISQSSRGANASSPRSHQPHWLDWMWIQILVLTRERSL